MNISLNLNNKVNVFYFETIVKKKKNNVNHNHFIMDILILYNTIDTN